MADHELVYLASRCGEVIGDNYVLAEPIGIGGMGVVYAATQRSLHRRVAVKLPRTELSQDPMVRKRFRIEALAASRVCHPNVVKVIDYGNDGGVPYLVMEHVDGPRLGELLRSQGPFSLLRALEIVAQVVAGLEEAHQQGVVHADVKCDNVMIETLAGGERRARLIDFGIAHVRGVGFDSHEQTVTGTAEYLAPEVIRGGVPTFASDVYAVGVMLYELVTGVTPFGTGSPATIMCRKLEAEAIPMSFRCGDCDIPVEIEALVMRMLERAPEVRFQDAGALRCALADVFDIASAFDREATPRRSHACSNEAPTSPMPGDGVDGSPKVVSTPHATERERLAYQHEQIGFAVATGDADSIAVAYLELADLLIVAKRPAAAVAELENGVALLSRRGAVGDALWRVLLTLAALYDGIGDRARARSAAREAHEQAVLVGSTVGTRRADALCVRLAKGRASTHRSRLW